MANTNGSELSTQDLIENTSALTNLSSDWNKSVMDAGLSSLDISGAFSSLTGQGVAVQYVESLQNAINKIEKNAFDISSIISQTATEQDEIDRKAAAESNNKPYNSYIHGGGGSGYSGNSSSSGSNDYGDKENPDTTINPGGDPQKVELTEDEKIKLVEEFQALFDGNLYDVLFNKNFASKVKEKLLASPNLSKEIKEVLLKMDKNEVQVMLQKMYLSGDQISGFSKMVVTVFDKNLKERDEKTDIYDAAENISKTYSDMADKDDFQDTIKDLYNGIAPIGEVDDNTIYFTRDFVDTLAETARVTPEEILTSAGFKDDLSTSIKDIANTFAVLRGAKDCDSKISSSLYSNIIIKTKG